MNSFVLQLLHSLGGLTGVHVTDTSAGVRPFLSLDHGPGSQLIRLPGPVFCVQ